MKTSPAATLTNKHQISLIHIIAIIAILFVTGAILALMGRNYICECGIIKLWHTNPNSSENSQHVSDMYTFSHIIHGYIFYYIAKKIAPKQKTGILLVAAVIIEALWEIVENSPFIIDRYRTTTISLDYYGDSIINSISDIIAMIGGFYLAYKIPIKVILVSALLMEIVVGYLIRDNLTLNIIMLIYPFEWIQHWQMRI